MGKLTDGEFGVLTGQLAGFVNNGLRDVYLAGMQLALECLKGARRSFRAALKQGIERLACIKLALDKSDHAVLLGLTLRYEK
jgi:hypothetical protein